MTDNIVTRLRNDCHCLAFMTPNAFVPCDKCEAANEIERLRVERDCWRTVAIGAYRWEYYDTAESNAQFDFQLEVRRVMGEADLD